MFVLYIDENEKDNGLCPRMKKGITTFFLVKLYIQYLFDDDNDYDNDYNNDNDNANDNVDSNGNILTL